MSWKATSAVREHSQTVGTARLVMFLIADSANDAGWHSFDKQEDLAKGANASTRAVERAIKSAIDLGELEVHRPDRSGRNQYSVMLPGLAIFEDEDERKRRDEHYANLSIGRAERTRQNRANRQANRRSEDPTLASGPSTPPPDASVGSHPTPVSAPDPTPVSGHHPTPASGLKGNPNTNPNETPEKELALAAEALWDCYPHLRRDIDPARTLDHLKLLSVDDVARIELMAKALAEDLVSDEWDGGRFAPKFSTWLKNRVWDRPLKPVAEILELNPLRGVEVSDPDPEFQRLFCRDVSEDVWEIWIAKFWHGRKGDTYVLGGDSRTYSWASLRYRRVLDDIAKRAGYAGCELIEAAPPHQSDQQENAA